MVMEQEQNSTGNRLAINVILFREQIYKFYLIIKICDKGIDAYFTHKKEVYVIENA